MTGVYQQYNKVRTRQKQSFKQSVKNRRAAIMTIAAKPNQQLCLTERWSQLLVYYSDYLIRY